MKKEEHVLAKWLSGEVSDQQLKDQVGDDPVESYRVILNELESLAAPERDQKRKDEFFKLLDQPKKAPQKSKILVLRPFAVAASLLLLMGLIVGLQKTTYTSTNSLQMVVLPDESRVTLEPNSSFSYNKVLYAFRRTLDLKGNAFFEVEKGSDFRVQSELGSVEVLGTSFRVFDRKGIFKVQCFSGTVRVQTDNRQEIITKGEEFGNRLENTRTHDLNNHIDAIEHFDNVPLKTVLAELSAIFSIDIQFDASNPLFEEGFSGTINSDDLDLSLNIVMRPFELNYERTQDSIIVLPN
jgi:ferric-dicitrate binding protein FerR (iron transport regulator)